MNRIAGAVLLAVLAAGCITRPTDFYPPPMDPGRRVNVQDCSQPVDTTGGNLMCTTVTEAQRRIMAEQEARLAKMRKEAEEKAAREKAERERLAALAAEEAARKARLAEEERLAAERRRLEAEAEAARKAAEERARQEALAAAALAKQRAEQEAREAAARECRRLEQARSEGRAALASWVATYGKDDEFKAIAGQITAFLDRPSRAKPCPPAP